MKQETRHGSDGENALKFWKWLTIGMGVFFTYLCVTRPDVLNIIFSVGFESGLIYFYFKFRKMWASHN